MSNSILNGFAAALIEIGATRENGRELGRTGITAFRPNQKVEDFWIALNGYKIELININGYLHVALEKSHVK